jgi:preprotein translocase subunit SecE
MAEAKKQGGFGKRISDWFRGMKSELKKVVWPSRKQVINHTVVALTVMICVGIIVWGMDFVSNRLVQLLISIGG